MISILSLNWETALFFSSGFMSLILCTNIDWSQMQCVLPAGVRIYSSGLDTDDASTYPRSYPIVLTGTCHSYPIVLTGTCHSHSDLQVWLENNNILYKFCSILSKPYGQNCYCLLYTRHLFNYVVISCRGRWLKNLCQLHFISGSYLWRYNWSLPNSGELLCW